MNRVTMTRLGVAGLFVMLSATSWRANSVSAQASAPLLLLVDETAIDHGPPPHLIPSEAVNELIGKVGLREPLPYFAARIGQDITLKGGVAGNDGWFALSQVPATWASQPGAADGLENFAIAGPGLGSPNELGDRSELLMSVTGVVPLRQEGLGRLVGRTVCAIVYDTDIVVSAGPMSSASLSGINLGVIALEVTGLDQNGTEWPDVKARVADALTVCTGALAPLSDAPPVSTGQ